LSALRWQKWLSQPRFPNHRRFDGIVRSSVFLICGHLRHLWTKCLAAEVFDEPSPAVENAAGENAAGDTHLHDEQTDD
jgi:hypothetical protein